MSVGMCLIYLGAALLGACVWTSVISSRVDPSTIMQCPLSFFMAFVLKSVLSDVRYYNCCCPFISNT